MMDGIYCLNIHNMLDRFIIQLIWFYTVSKNGIKLFLKKVVHSAYSDKCHKTIFFGIEEILCSWADWHEAYLVQIGCKHETH